MAKLSKVKGKNRLRYRLILMQVPYDKSRRYQKITRAKGSLGLAQQIEYKTLHNNYNTLDVQQWRNAGLVSPKEVKILLASIGKGKIDTEIEEFLGGNKVTEIRRKVINEFISDMFDFNPQNPKIPARLRLAILNRDRSTCQICGMSAPDIDIEVDHIIPSSKEGKTIPENLQCVCFPCNIGKSNKFKFHSDDNKLARNGLSY